MMWQSDLELCIFAMSKIGGGVSVLLLLTVSAGLLVFLWCPIYFSLICGAVLYRKDVWYLSQFFAIKLQKLLAAADKK